ncbi:nuclear transport factor 2 family protein [Candidatus Fukatsuia endosymbiont of Tuberolachnus salignus]|uniref:nuclear transport factor 2 family protein n=1 Tax=Candidatus Fukatsuia endosymbiont of Tuberolachnus salignus TaxID=3077957 RepID=UPI00313B64EA
MDNNLKSFTHFMEKREEVAQSYVCGDPVPLVNIATLVSPATFFDPRGYVVQQAADDVSRTYQQGAKAFKTGSETHFEILHMAASDSIAYWVGFQHATVHMNESKDPCPMYLRVTEIFRREDNEWKLIHRHADGAQQPSLTQST